MSIKQSMRSLLDKVCGCKRDKKPDCGCGDGNCDCGKTKCRSTDAEISAEEVVTEEIFPEGKHARIDKQANADKPRRAASKSNAAAHAANRKIIHGESPVKPTASRRKTRPTNNDYKMIDPTNDSADTSKS